MTGAIERRIERVRALLTPEHLDDDAIPAPGPLDDLECEAVHACCRHADFLADLRIAALVDGLSLAPMRPIPPRQAMRPALPPRVVPAQRTDVTAAPESDLSKGSAASRAV